MAASVDVVVAGEPVSLYAERALYWPRRRRLLIADLHLGKADVFRRAGIGLPSGGTTHDLQRMGALIDASRARELWVLGDVLHGPAPDAQWRRTWLRWREGYPGVSIGALVGNHDRALAGAGLGIELLGDAFDDAPFALRHEPVAHPVLHVLCGHLHPCLGLPGLGPRRWPAFWLRRDRTVLPAFSAFTGGVAVEPAPGEAVAVCVEDTVTLIRGRSRASK
jgi:DNA ligase-associated metallophosphoesterase